MQIYVPRGRRQRQEPLPREGVLPSMPRTPVSPTHSKSPPAVAHPDSPPKEEATPAEKPIPKTSPKKTRQEVQVYVPKAKRQSIEEHAPILLPSEPPQCFSPTRSPSKTLDGMPRSFSSQSLGELQKTHGDGIPRSFSSRSLGEMAREPASPEHPKAKKQRGDAQKVIKVKKSGKQIIAEVKMAKRMKEREKQQALSASSKEKIDEMAMMGNCDGMPETNLGGAANHDFVHIKKDVSAGVDVSRDKFIQMYSLSTDSEELLGQSASDEDVSELPADGDAEPEAGEEMRKDPISEKDADMIEAEEEFFWADEDGLSMNADTISARKDIDTKYTEKSFESGVDILRKSPPGDADKASSSSLDKSVISTKDCARDEREVGLEPAQPYNSETAEASDIVMEDVQEKTPVPSVMTSSKEVLGGNDSIKASSDICAMPSVGNESKDVINEAPSSSSHKQYPTADDSNKNLHTTKEGEDTANAIVSCDKKEEEISDSNNDMRQDKLLLKSTNPSLDGATKGDAEVIIENETLCNTGNISAAINKDNSSIVLESDDSAQTIHQDQVVGMDVTSASTESIEVEKSKSGNNTLENESLQPHILSDSKDVAEKNISNPEVCDSLNAVQSPNSVPVMQLSNTMLDNSNMGLASSDKEQDDVKTASSFDASLGNSDTVLAGSVVEQDSGEIKGSSSIVIDNNTGEVGKVLQSADLVFAEDGQTPSEPGQIEPSRDEDMPNNYTTEFPDENKQELREGKCDTQSGVIIQDVADAGVSAVAMETGEDEGEDDEESWDKMFDDDGECLDPSLMAEVRRFSRNCRLDLRCL